MRNSFLIILIVLIEAAMFIGGTFLQIFIIVEQCADRMYLVWFII